MLESWKYWPQQWLYIGAFVVSFDIMMTIKSIYIVAWFGFLVCAFVLADVVVKTYDALFSKRKFIDDAHKKAVLITGCDSGFGILFAQRLADMGFVVYATVLSPEGEPARKLALHSNIQVVKLDVTVQSSIDVVVRYVTADLKENGRKFWGLVNTAGISQYSDVEYATMDHYERLMQVNAFGAVRVCKSFLPLLRAAGHGRIVSIPSQAGRHTVPCTTAYSMSKHALSSFTNGLRVELKPWNISVHAIEPSLFQTTSTFEECRKTKEDNYRKLWHAAQHEIKEAYGDSYREAKIKAFVEFTKEHKRPRDELVEVCDDLVHAVAGLDPKARYTPGTKVKAQMRILSQLPQELADKLLSPKMKEQPAQVKRSLLPSRAQS